MSTKTQNSTLSLKTLRGVFEQPKMNHRRDFLRENKLNLRELQKTTTHKLTQQKEEFERKQNKYLQNFHKTQEPTLDRRSASQSRNDCRQSRIAASIDDAGGGDGTKTTIRGKPNYIGYRRTCSQQRKSFEQLQPVTSCCCNHQQLKQRNTQHKESNYRDHMPRSASAVSILSKAESCDKEIQTEDINDEDFLYEALKKCSSSEVHLLQKQKSIDQLQTSNLQKRHANPSLLHCESELNSTRFRKQAAVFEDHFEDNKSQRDHKLQYTPRSPHNHMLNGHNHTQDDAIENGVQEDLHQHFQNLNLASDIRRDPETQLSARSRQTLCSTSTKRSVHTLGCRDDVRLPRYLEKEKHEKEVERIRELTKDPHCPLGHYALSEEERLKALNKAQKKMDSLINELNHMPMTTETLRLRHRKVEIEKELTQIELDIRLYSKPTVYIPETPLQY